jgi:hypothetical protein
MFGFSIAKLVIIGLVIAAILGYIGVLKFEVSHLTTKLHASEVAFETYKINVESMQTALKSSNAALTLQAKTSLVAALAADEAKNKAIKERIANDVKAKSIVVPASTVSVLNDSATAGSVTGGTPPTVSGNASGASTPETDFTLQDVEDTVADNNAEHWKCIKVVKAWQAFWKEFAANVAQVASHNGNTR